MAFSALWTIQKQWGQVTFPRLYNYITQLASERVFCSVPWGKQDENINTGDEYVLECIGIDREIYVAKRMDGMVDSFWSD